MISSFNDILLVRKDVLFTGKYGNMLLKRNTSEWHEVLNSLKIILAFGGTFKVGQLKLRKVERSLYEIFGVRVTRNRLKILVNFMESKPVEDT